MSKNKLIKQNELLKALKSSNENNFGKTLAELDAVLTLEALPALASVFHATISERNKEELLAFFNNLSASDAQETIIQILVDPENLPIRQELLSTIWNSRLDYSTYLAEFVEMSVEGDYLEALECLTIIENLEGPFEESDILEAQLHLKEYLESGNKNDQKATLISEIALLIKNFNEELADFDLEDLD
jgi:uncharacterized Zn finger protein